MSVVRQRTTTRVGEPEVVWSAATASEDVDRPIRPNRVRPAPSRGRMPPPNMYKRHRPRRMMRPGPDRLSFDVQFDFLVRGLVIVPFVR